MPVSSSSSKTAVASVTSITYKKFNSKNNTQKKKLFGQHIRTVHIEKSTLFILVHRQGLELEDVLPIPCLQFE